jgi:hypothetical protein
MTRKTPQVRIPPIVNAAIAHREHIDRPLIGHRERSAATLVIC